MALFPMPEDWASVKVNLDIATARKAVLSLDAQHLPLQGLEIQILSLA